MGNGTRRPVQTEYTLAGKGEMIEPILERLAEFSITCEPKVIFKDGKQLDFEGVFGNNIQLSTVYRIRLLTLNFEARFGSVTSIVLA